MLSMLASRRQRYLARMRSHLDVPHREDHPLGQGDHLTIGGFRQVPDTNHMS